MLGRFTVALGLIPVVTACSAVTTVRSPAQFVAAKAPKVIWVTTTQYGDLALVSPHVTADSIAGLADGAHYLELPLASVRSMRARQSSPLRTIFLIGGITAGIAALAVAGANGKGGESTAACTDPTNPQRCPNGPGQ